MNNLPLESGVIQTNMQKLFAWARCGSLWTYSLGISCCNMEFLSAVSPRFDWERFGSLPLDDYHNADLLLITGPVNKKFAPEILRIYQEMPSPKFVISMGSCANTGGLFREKCSEIIDGVDKIIPVDVYVPGCPPRPEALIFGLMKIQQKITRNVSDDINI